LGAVTPVPGYSDERIHLFLARDLTPAVQKLDPDEFIEVQALPLSQVAVMITSGEIEDAKTIAAIFRVLHKLRCEDL
jgi:ADP-ribose pyrophosphatase